jgi:hypothetical protein
VAEDVTASFNLSVESNAAQVARDGAEGLANLQEKMQGSVDELRQLNAAFRALKGGAGVSTAALDEVKRKLAAQKAQLAAQQQAFIKAGGTGRELGAKQRAQAERETAAAKAKALFEAKQKTLAADASKLAARHSAMLVAGSLAVAASFVAVGAAAVGAYAKLVQFGLGAADARRSELLQLEGLSKIRNGLWYLGAGYQLAADKGSFLQDQIDNVAASSAVGRDQIAGYARQLYTTGLRSGNLQAALEAMTITASTQGEEQAQRFAGMAQGARMAGISIKKLSDDVKARLGGIAAQQALGLSVQLMKLRENVNRLFSGVKLEPFLRGLKMVTDLFAFNTIEGMALQSILEDLFSPLINGAPTAGTIVRKVFQGMIIGTLKLQNAFLDLQLAYYGIFGGSKTREGSKMFHLVAKAGELALVGLAGAALLASGGLILTAAGLAAVVAAGGAVGAGLAKVDHYLERWGTSTFGIGSNFAKGIADGITGGVPGVVGAVVSLGGAVIKAFRDKLQIKSPSRVMFKDGLNVAVGQARGIDAGRPQVEQAVRRSMVAPVMSATGGGGGGSTAAPSLPPIEIHMHGIATAADVEAGVAAALEKILSRQVVKAGGKAA